MGKRYNGKTIVVTNKQYKAVRALKSGESLSISVHRVPKTTRCEVIAGGREPLRCHMTIDSSPQRHTTKVVTIKRL